MSDIIKLKALCAELKMVIFTAKRSKVNGVENEVFVLIADVWALRPHHPPNEMTLFGSAAG